MAIGLALLPPHQGNPSHEEKGHKSLIVKMLTSNPLGLNILQTLFAEPAPVRLSEGAGEGVAPEAKIFPE